MVSLKELDARIRQWNVNRKRAKEINAALPEAIDLLVLVMQAGLDFQVALAHYLDKAPHNALWEEFSTLQSEIRTGLSRTDALRHLAARVREPGLKETARTIIQGIELGSSLTPILRTQAQALRKQRAYAAEKQAATAPLKLMFPLLVFIFPTIFVILIAPMVIQMSGQRILP
jgi:tight adherence protein C